MKPLRWLGTWATAPVFALIVSGCNSASSSQDRSAPTASATSPSTASSAPHRPHGINVSLPLRGIRPAQPFKMLVSVDDDGDPHTVYMDPTDSFEYKPSQFVLRPGERKEVTAKLKPTESGLATIDITSVGYKNFMFIVDGGFLGKLKPQVPTSMDSGQKYPVTFSIVNSQDSPVHLDADTTITISAVNARLTPPNQRESPSSDGLSEVTIPVPAGSTSTEAVTVRPTSYRGEPIVLTASIRPFNQMYSANSNVVLSEQRIELPVLPAWWYTLLLAIAGACIPPIYRFTTLIADSGKCDLTVCFRGGMKLITGAVAGSIAYLFASWDIIGVKLDTSSSRTFLILGFLFSYVGVDVLLRRVLGEQSPAQASEPAKTAQPDSSVAEPATPATKTATSGSN